MSSRALILNKTLNLVNPQNKSLACVKAHSFNLGRNLKFLLFSKIFKHP